MLYGINRGHALSLFPQFRQGDEAVVPAPIYEGESFSSRMKRSLTRPVGRSPNASATAEPRPPITTRDRYEPPNFRRRCRHAGRRLAARNGRAALSPPALAADARVDVDSPLPARAATGRIDVHHHFLPPAHAEALQRRGLARFAGQAIAPGRPRAPWR